MKVVLNFPLFCEDAIPMLIKQSFFDARYRQYTSDHTGMFADMMDFQPCKWADAYIVLGCEDYRRYLAEETPLPNTPTPIVYHPL